MKWKKNEMISYILKMGELWNLKKLNVENQK